MQRESDSSAKFITSNGDEDVRQDLIRARAKVDAAQPHIVTWPSQESGHYLLPTEDQMTLLQGQQREQVREQNYGSHLFGVVALRVHPANLRVFVGHCNKDLSDSFFC